MPRLSAIPLAIPQAVACLIAMPVLAAPPDRFDARIGSLRKESGAPGLSIAIVEAGRTTLACGYGIRRGRN